MGPCHSESDFFPCLLSTYCISDSAECTCGSHPQGRPSGDRHGAAHLFSLSYAYAEKNVFPLFPVTDLSFLTNLSPRAARKNTALVYSGQFNLIGYVRPLGHARLSLLSAPSSAPLLLAASGSVGTGGVCGPVCGPVRACFSGICTCCWRPEPRLAPSSLHLALDTLISTASGPLPGLSPPTPAAVTQPCGGPRVARESRTSELPSFQPAASPGSLP